MKNVREAIFSGSWYPGTSSEVYRQLAKWDSELQDMERNIIGGIVPHAGWYFSGKLAYDVIRRFPEDLNILVVLGGHLPGYSPVLYCPSEECETPCGNLPVFTSLIEFLKGVIPVEADNQPDNTVEVQLPIIRAVFDEIQIVPLRVPAGIKCLDIIDPIIEYSEDKNLKTAFLGSTDLTHYGPNYDYTPDESLNNPVKWVKKSDEKILSSFLNLRPDDILNLALETKSACSAGAAACTAEFARRKGIKKGTLLNYDTSYSRQKSDSFVGYGSVIYQL